ncbi:tetratricopeptide repeat protein [Acidobacteriota bacterium]
MRLRTFILFVFICSLCLVASNYPQQSAAQLFQSALYEEEVTGDLEKAISLYSKVIELGEESLAAKAQLQIGLCYEKLGRTEAIKAYELVLEKYAGQKDQVAAARARLAELKKEEPKELMVTKTRFGMNEPFGLSPDGTTMVGVHISPEGGQNIVISHLEKQEREYITHFEWMDENGEYLDEYYWTYNPVWSPDGEEIAYVASYSSREGKSDNNLSVSSLDGKTRVLLRSETDWFTPYVWMPDGNFILSVKGDKDNNQELGLIPSQGGEFKNLISLKGEVEPYGRSRASASVSPDGRFIVYTDIPPNEESDLFITTSEGKIPWPLAPSPAVDKMPRWSPDGKHIIFLSNRHGGWALWGVSVVEGQPGDPFLIRDGMGDNLFGNWTVHGLVSWNWVQIRDIFLLDVNPETGQPAGKPKQLDYMPAGSNSLPVFAPQGNRLAFIGGDIAADRFSLVVIQGDKDSKQMYEIPQGFRPMMIRWMPDGLGIALYSSNFNGRKALLSLTFDSEKWETFSLPDLKSWRPLNFAGNAKNILYGKYGLVEEGAGIYEYNLETGEERLVYKPEEDGEVDFMLMECSKDFKKVAFVESGAKLIVVDLGTGESHDVTSDRPIFFASWSPDGQRFVTSGPLRGETEKERLSLRIFSISNGAVQAYDMSEDLPKASQIYQPEWSADGTQVVFFLRANKSEHLIYKNIIPEEKK